MCLYLPFLIFCFMGIGLLHRNEVVSRTRSASKLNLHSIMEEYDSTSNRTGQIWNFATSETETIYLYKTLLTKEHFFNASNLAIFRNELRLGLGSYFNNNVVIDQQNTPRNYTFTFESKKKSSKKQISDDIHKRLPNNISYEVIPRCSIVGNSGLILNSTCGNDIDKADFVFRCNAAPLKAFVVDAGSKSNFTTFNPSILETRYQKLSQPDNVTRFLSDMKEYRELLWAPCYTAVTMENCTKVLKLYNLTENKFVLGYPSHFKKVQEFWKSRGFKKRITTGFYLVNVAISRCRELHLYGFWPFLQEVDSAIKSVRYHYFEEIKPDLSKVEKVHDMQSEFSVLLQLHNLGILKIHIGRCNS